MKSEQSCYVVPEEWSGKRIDAFLASQSEKLSRGYFQKLLSRHLIKLNERPAKASTLIKAGDQVYVEAPSIVAALKPEAIPLDILYEDEDILVVNKPINMTVHPNRIEEASGTLVQAILYHSISVAEAVYDINSLISRLRPGIVHRLDKNTSGIMVIAKTPQALKKLSEDFRHHLVEKEYTALVYGQVTDTVTLHTNIKRRASRKNLMGVNKEGREAVSHLEPIDHYFLPETEQEFTLLRCTIETGRTHQIRVHCKFSGHPIIGDPLYSNKPSREASNWLGAKRQMLHATKLTFHHPRTGELRTFSAPFPGDIMEILTKLQPA